MKNNDATNHSSADHYYRFLTKWKSARKMKSEKLTLIFSPHIDDAFLSLYYAISSGSLGRNIVCANVFFISDSTISTKRSTDFSIVTNASTVRLKEELEFAEHLNKHRINYLPVFLGFNAEEIDLYYEFIASRAARLLPSNFAKKKANAFIRSYALGRADRIRLHDVIQATVNNFKSNMNALLLPIGVGGSLDHLMLRHTLSDFSEKMRVGLYADVPYVHEYGFDSIEKLGRNVPGNFTNVQKIKFNASEKGRLFKKLYPSQYSKDIESSLRAIAKNTGEVIFWNR